MATNLLDLMSHIQDQYKDGQTQGKQSALAKLAGQAYGAPRDQRQGLVQQAIGVDPQSGFALDKSLQGGDDAKMVRVKQLAGSLVAMPEQMRPQAYSRVMQELQGIGMGEGLPPSWSEDLLPYAQQLASGEKSDLPNSVQEYQYAQKNPGYQQFLSGRDPTQLTQIDYTDPATGQVGKLQVQWNPRTKQMTDMDGNPVYPNGGQAQDNRTQGMGSTGGGAQVLDDALSNAVMQQESGGDPNAVSSAGARGLMQIMPETARDPGYGVQPMQNQSPQENVRIGQDYLKAMLAKYGGNQQLALAAYNGGPGRVDAALQRANGNPQQAMQYLPQETQKYPGAVQARMGQTAPTAGRTGFTAGKGAEPPTQLQLNADARDQERLRIAQDAEARAANPNKAQKPLPVTAIRLIKDETDAIDSAGTMDTIMSRIAGRINSGALKLGFSENLMASARNKMGQNNESSRNYQSFISDLNKARNESLRLNKGVQTEGDAQRAWDELIANPNDPKFVLQRMTEIKEINARAIRLRQSNVDMIRLNYGAEPMDFAAREGGGQKPAIGGLSPAEQQELDKLRKRFGR